LSAPCVRFTQPQQRNPASWHWISSFEDTWGEKYPHVVLSWKRHRTELTAFFKYPEAVRRLIYTTNPIESLNSRVRKTVKGESVFPTETALFKALYMAVAETEKRWTMRTRDWSEIIAQLSIFFQDRLRTISAEPSTIGVYTIFGTLP